MSDREFSLSLNNQIDEVVSTLEQKIAQNAKLLIQIDPDDHDEPDFYKGKSKTFSRIRAIMTQNENAVRIMDDCFEAIKKLRLLKKYISKLKAQTLLYYLNHYNDFSFEEFRKNLFTKASTKKKATPNSSEAIRL